MDELTRGKLSIVLHDAEALADEIRTMLEEAGPERKPPDKVMVAVLVASTDGKRYAWANRFGVDEITIRRWALGKTIPGAADHEAIVKAYQDLK